MIIQLQTTYVEYRYFGNLAIYIGTVK